MVSSSLQNKLKLAAAIYDIDPPRYHQLNYSNFNYNSQLNVTELRQMWLSHNEAPEFADVPIDMYLHIPFCVQQCKFCQYPTLPFLGESKAQAYVAYLSDYLTFLADSFKNRKIRFLYVGGGTTNTLSARQIDQLLGKIFSLYQFEEGRRERTFEMHPAMATREQIEIVAKHGINRISFGLESFNERTIQLENRQYASPQRIKELVQICKENRILDVNANLIIGLNEETEEEILHSARETCHTGLDSVIVHTLMSKIETSSWYTSKDDFYRRLSEFGPRLEQEFNANGFQGHFHDDEKYMVFAFRRDKPPFPFNYEAFSLRRSSLLAFGLGALGAIHGKCRYLNGKQIHSFTADLPLQLAHLSEKQQIALAIARSLTRSSMNLAELNVSYQMDLLQVFREEFGYLFSENIFARQGDLISWKSEDLRLRNIATLIFMEEAALAELLASKQKGDNLFNRGWSQDLPANTPPILEKIKNFDNGIYAYKDNQKRGENLRLRFENKANHRLFILEISSPAEKYFLKSHSGLGISYLSDQLTGAEEQLLKGVAEFL